MDTASPESKTSTEKSRSAEAPDESETRTRNGKSPAACDSPPSYTAREWNWPSMTLESPQRRLSARRIALHGGPLRAHRGPAGAVRERRISGQPVAPGMTQPSAHRGDIQGLRALAVLLVARLRPMCLDVEVPGR